MPSKKVKKASTPKTPQDGRSLTDKATEADKAAARGVEAAKKAAKKAEADKAAAAKAEAARIAAKAEAAKTATPDRLVWALNGPRWEAPSLKVPGRTYTVTYVEEQGWTGGYNGQKAGCPAAGVFHPLASYARASVQAVEDAIE